MGSWREEGQRKRSKERSTDLSEDLITEILQHLPVRSLLRFKCVCKLWYNQIICPNFIAMHRMNSHNHTIGRPIFCYLFSRSPTSVTVSFDPLPETITSTISFRFNGFPVDLTVPVHEPGNFRIVGCSGGVVCLMRGDEYVLWNPATSQYRKINYHKDDFIKNKVWFTHGFCFDPVSNAFKLIQIALLVKQRVSIFTTCDSTWREKTIDIPYQLLFGNYGGNIKFAACVKRYMYWHFQVRGRYNVLSESMHIICFDMIDEMFKRIELPPHGAKDFSTLTFADYKDSLAMFAHWNVGYGDYCSSFDVWTLSYHDQSWSKKLTCEPSVSFQRVLGVFAKDDIDLLVLGTSRTNSTTTMVLYDPESKQEMECPLEASLNMSFWYYCSFASLD